MPLSSEFMLKHFKVCSTDTSLLISHAVTADEQFQIFRRMVVPSSSGSSKFFFHLKLNALTSFETFGITSAMAQLRFVFFWRRCYNRKSRISLFIRDLPQKKSRFQNRTCHKASRLNCLYTVITKESACSQKGEDPEEYGLTQLIKNLKDKIRTWKSKRRIEMLRGRGLKRPKPKLGCSATGEFACSRDGP